MLAALLVGAAALLADATPGVALAVQGLTAAQDRVGAARLAARAAVLAHDLADERDDAAIRAAGRAGSAADRSRTDRQTPDVLAGAPAEVRTALAGLPSVRKAADAGKGGPQAVTAAYQPLIDALGRLAGPVTAPLGRAVDAAARQRGLLVGALTAGGAQRGPVAAAQSAHVQEDAALGEFRAVAPADLRARYDRTVTGAETAQAERDLAKLLSGPELTSSDRDLGTTQTAAALTARLALMRGVETSAAADEVQQAAARRDHEVTVLELHGALAVLCLIVLVGALVTLFRGLNRPLAALHRWSRSDAESGQGAEVIGADEFATIARRVNALTHEAQALRGRVHELTTERDSLSGKYNGLIAEREGLLRIRDDLMRSREELAARLAGSGARTAGQLTYVNLGLRTLGLVERQLALIEGLEDREQDPERLDHLFKLDHLATRMRRNSENLLVLAGTEHSHGATARPVPLVDVARAAISEIERYERVRIQTMPDAPVAGRAADDVSHLIAELLDNATGFSEPSTPVHLSGWLLENGEVMLSVEDTGIGMPDERLNQFNELLADPDPEPPGAAAGMGLYVVARLAHRHGVRTQLRPQAGGGTTAVLVLPQLLLPPVDPNEPPATPIEAALAGSGLTGSRRAGHVPADEAWSASLSATGFVTPTGPETTGVPLAGAVPEPVGGPGSGMPPAGAPPIRVPAQAPPPGAVPPAHAVQHDRSAPETGAGGLTAMGLPRRVARGTGMGDMIVHEPRRRQGSPVDPAELRRKLGGLQRGTQAGRRDAAYEVSNGTGPMTGVPGAAPQEAAPPQSAPRHAAPGARQSAPEAHSTQGDAGPAENAEEATR